MHASLAAALIKIANPKPEESIFDPYCKDGVIVIEAALLGSKEIYAQDVVENNIRNAKINAKMAKVNIAWENPQKQVDYLITNIWVPALQPRSKEKIAQMLEENKEKVKKKVLMLTNWKNAEKSIGKEWNVEEKRTITRGLIRNYLFILRKNSS